MSDPASDADGAPGGRPAARREAPGRPARGVLVIGYGNTLRSDDGVGPRVAGLLADDPRLAGATVTARHQLTPELAGDIRSAVLVVLIDATTEAPPGAVVVRPVEAWVEPRAGAGAAAGAAAGAGAGVGGGPGATSHHVDPGVLLALARDLYGASPEAHLVSVGVADMGPGEVLSPRVATTLPAAADAVARLVAASRHARGT